MNSKHMDRKKVINILIANGYYSIDGLSGEEEILALAICLKEKTNKELIADYLNSFKKDREEAILLKKYPEIFSFNGIQKHVKKILNYHELLNEISELTVSY